MVAFHGCFSSGVFSYFLQKFPPVRCFLRWFCVSGAGLDQGKKQQRVGLMAQYLAAVQLLQYSREAVTGPGAAASGEAMRAKLLRFAASLKLNVSWPVSLPNSNQ
jgi:hypothetical protein